MIHDNNNTNSVALNFSRSGVDDLDAIYCCMLACGWKYLRSELQRLLSLASDVRVCWAQTEDGRIVAGMGITTTVFEKRQGCLEPLSLIGMMVTRPNYRRRGIAKQIFAALTPPDSNAALVATEVGSKVYLQQNFAAASAMAASRPLFEHPDAEALLVELRQDGHVSNSTVETAHIATVVALDAEIRGIERTRVLEAIAAGTADGSVTARMVMARDSGGGVRGYAVMSYYPCGKMFLGPVAAVTADDAVAMLAALLVPGSYSPAKDNAPQTTGAGARTAASTSDSGVTLKPVSVFLSGDPLAVELAAKLQALSFKHRATLVAMNRYADSAGGGRICAANDGVDLYVDESELKYAAMASPAWG